MLMAKKFEQVLFPVSRRSGTRSFCHVRGALLLVNVSRSVRAAGGRAGAQAHRVLRLSRSLPPLQISSPEPLKRRARHGVIRLVEQRVGGEFDCSVEKSVEFSVEYYCIKKLNF